MGRARWLIRRCLAVAVGSVLAGAGILCAGAREAGAAPVRLAFDRDGSVWIGNATGADAKRLGPQGHNIAVAANGAEVATMRGSTADPSVAMYSADGGPTRTFTVPEPGPPLLAGGVLGLSADGRYLAVQTPDDVDVVDTATGKPVTELMGAHSASWAPNGADRLAYTGLAPESPLQVWTPSGASVRILSSNVNSPVWGPRAIAFERSNQIWTVDPNGTHLKRVTSVRGGTATTTFTGLTPAFWSPNGAWLVAEYDENTLFHAALVSLRNGSTQIISVGGDYATPLAFTPSSNRFLFSVGNRLVTRTLSETGTRTLLAGTAYGLWNT